MLEVPLVDSTQYDGLEEAFEAQYRPTPESLAEYKRLVALGPFSWETPSPTPSPSETSPPTK